MEPEDYELFVQRSQRRRRTTFVAALTVLVALLYVPWVVVPTGLFSASTAEGISVLTGLLVLACWRGLLLRLSDSADAAERRAIFRVAGGIVAAIVALAALSWIFGFIGSSGALFTFALLVFLGMMLGRSMLGRALSSG